jgi:hypothetical protein
MTPDHGWPAKRAQQTCLARRRAGSQPDLIRLTSVGRPPGARAAARVGGRIHCKGFIPKMKKVLTFELLSTVVAATAFLFSQVLVVVAALVGVVVSALELEVAGLAVCIAIAAVPSIAVLILLARMVYEAESQYIA